MNENETTETQKQVNGFTPGPWKHQFLTAIELPDGGVMEVEAWLTPEGPNPFHNERYEELKSNVALMSAAPDLYAALELYVNAFSLGFPSPNILVESGQRALAKARGEREGK